MLHAQLSQSTLQLGVDVTAVEAHPVVAAATGARGAAAPSAAAAAVGADGVSAAAALQRYSGEKGAISSAISEQGAISSAISDEPEGVGGLLRLLHWLGGALPHQVWAHGRYMAGAWPVAWPLRGRCVAVTLPLHCPTTGVGAGSRDGRSDRRHAIGMSRRRGCPR